MTDLLLDDNRDLLIVNGDLVIGESSIQNQKLLIYCDKGSFKEFPMRGVGARRYLEDGTFEAFSREISQEFTLDGMQVNKIVANELELTVDAFYK